jgi:hypothetical protein
MSALRVSCKPHVLARVSHMHMTNLDDNRICPPFAKLVLPTNQSHLLADVLQLLHVLGLRQR